MEPSKPGLVDTGWFGAAMSTRVNSQDDPCTFPFQVDDRLQRWLGGTASRRRKNSSALCGKRVCQIFMRKAPGSADTPGSEDPDISVGEV